MMRGQDVEIPRAGHRLHHPAVAEEPAHEEPCFFKGMDGDFHQRLAGALVGNLGNAVEGGFDTAFRLGGELADFLG